MPGRTRRPREPREERFPLRIGPAGQEPMTRSTLNPTGDAITVSALDPAGIRQRERAHAEVRARGEGRRERRIGEGDVVEEPNFWISRGNNWGPVSDYTTPAKWGLTAGLYAFRATVEVLGIGTFAASQELPFRVR
jgi:hypothetical protein